MNKIEDYIFDKNDWVYFHDVILDVTWDNGKYKTHENNVKDFLKTQKRNL